jgi:hypothetical protein
VPSKSSWSLNIQRRKGVSFHDLFADVPPQNSITEAIFLRLDRQASIPADSSLHADEQKYAPTYSKQEQGRV